ncbi:MAG: hypothetical protein HYW70_01050 [Candidatus Nealsonbacteria bacterium]|nr:hypothetical protein [Candidatus Nealsonbacteria bacterium]
MELERTERGSDLGAAVMNRFGVTAFAFKNGIKLRRQRQCTYKNGEYTEILVRVPKFVGEIALYPDVTIGIWCNGRFCGIPERFFKNHGP